MTHAAIAADTNLLRHPTPRRYLTVFEALRNRPVVVLPAVDTELHKHLPIQARDYIESTAKRQGVHNGEIELANTACAISPDKARDTEMRYHTATRTAVRDTGLNLWAP